MSFARKQQPAPGTGNKRSFAAKRGDSGMFNQIVSAAPLGGFAAVQSIREGYPAAILKAASSFFGVTDARIQDIAQVPASTVRFAGDDLMEWGYFA